MQKTKIAKKPKSIKRPLSEDEIRKWKLAPDKVARDNLWNEVCPNDEMLDTDATTLMALDACANGRKTKRPAQGVEGEFANLPPKWSNVRGWKQFGRQLYSLLAYPEYESLVKEKGRQYAENHFASSWSQSYRDNVDPYIQGTGRQGWHDERKSESFAQARHRPILRWGLCATPEEIAAKSKLLRDGKIKIQWTKHPIPGPKGKARHPNEKARPDILKGFPNQGVYIITDNSSGYKIGWSNNIRQRIKNLQGANADPLELVHVIETNTPVELESLLHDRFKRRRTQPSTTNHEWFNLIGCDLEFLMRIKRLDC